MAFSAPDVYYYYPDYAIYYNTTHRSYVYQEKGIWLTGTVPPKVSASDLQGSRAVRMPFHDAPALHHASVVQHYPKNVPRQETIRRPARTKGVGRTSLSRVTK